MSEQNKPIQDTSKTYERIEDTSKTYERIEAAEAFLESEGYRRCDIPACNCGSWHQHKSPVPVRSARSGEPKEEKHEENTRPSGAEEPEVGAGSRPLTRMIQRCAQCGATQASHCDFDEPGVDHDSECDRMHHVFKPKTPSARSGEPPEGGTSVRPAEVYCPNHAPERFPVCPACSLAQARMMAKAADTERAEAKHWRERAEAAEAQLATSPASSGVSAIPARSGEPQALFRRAWFTLSSGQTSEWKIECDALTSDDWIALALMLSEILPPFGSVEGVPSGGRKLADALLRFKTKGAPLLIVDDVLTTGASMERQRNGREAIGAVVFARGQCPAWVTPLFQHSSAGAARSGEIGQQQKEKQP